MICHVSLHRKMVSKSSEMLSGFTETHEELRTGFSFLTISFPFLFLFHFYFYFSSLLFSWISVPPEVLRVFIYLAFQNLTMSRRERGSFLSIQLDSAGKL